MKHGVVNFLKPPGMTSSDAVVALRRLFQEKRVGHTGTLDPGAAGVLPICIGRATRLFDYLVDKDKDYLAEIAFGAATDTQDAYGSILEQRPTSVTKAALAKALPGFLGPQEQIAPMYSALKSGGKKLYELARAGEAPVEKRRQVYIHRLALVEQTGPQTFLLDVSCSRGTYVRTLCQDLGAALDAPAHLSFLLRSRSGRFSLDHAWTLEELQAQRAAGGLDQALLPPEAALAHLPQLRLRLDPVQRKRLQNGSAIQLPGQEIPEGPVRLYVEEQFWGIGQQGPEGLHMRLFLTEDDSIHG